MDDVIIVGSLSDKELKSSIDALVTYVDNSTKSMAKSFDSAITSMKNSLKGVKDATIAYDQLAAAKQKAMQNKSAEESFYTFIQKYRENAAKLANELKVMPSQSLDRQVQEYQRFEREINNVKRKIQELRTQLNEVGRNPNASRWEVKAITDQIALYEKEIKQLTSEQLASTKKIEQADNAAMAKKRAMYEETKKLIRELTVEERKATDAAKTISNAHQQTQAAIGGGVKKSSATEESESIRILRERIKEQELLRESMARGHVELAKQNEIIANLKRQLKDELMTQEEKRKAIEKQNDALERQKAKQLKQSQSDYIYRFNKANTESSRTIDAAEQKLRNLKRAVDDMRRSGLFDDVKLNKAQKAIDTLEQKIERMRSKRPMTMQDVLGMDESSIDAITRKMSALKRVSIDPNNAAQVKQLGDEYQRLSRLQSELLGRNIQATHSNNMLAQSFGYIRNRIVYALTLGAVTNFVKQVYDIRGQYELLERSLGVLVNSFERGSQIFNELNKMAIESPFTLMELAGAAKQLTAYNFSASEVVDTTRRLADISAALGVPMERLTYNLGQIRAQTVLTARDARDFANAGLPIVTELAKHFSELEGRVVSTGDVYDRMSKKMVSYSDVMSVLNRMTDEGGKFFEFQAKQAETLRVQMANLTLAWNNMLNELGERNQSLLTLPVKGLKVLLQNWQSIDRVIKSLIISFGLLKAAQMVAVNRFGGMATGLATTARQMGWLANAAKGLGQGLKALAVNPWTWVFVGIAAITDLVLSMQRAHEAIVELNQDIRNNAKESSDNLLKFLGNKGNQAENALAKQNKLTTEQGEKSWAEIRSQIEQSAISSNTLISELLQIEDINERVSKGFDYTQSIQKAQAALQDLKDTSITVTSDAGWFGMFGEGLVSDLKDYQEKLRKFLKSPEDSLNVKTTDARNEFLSELEETAQSISNFLQAYHITDPLQINEIYERVRAQIKAKNPEIKGELANIFDIELDKRMANLTNNAIDSNTSLWNMFMERLKHNSSSAFQDITDDWVNDKQQQLSNAQQKAINENLEYFKNSMPEAYNAVAAMVRDASQLKIHIGITFAAQQLTDFQKEVNKRIGGTGLNLLKGGTDAYNAYLPSSNDDFTKWVGARQKGIKTLREENKLYEKDNSDWAKERIKQNNEEISKQQTLLGLFHQSAEENKKSANANKTRKNTGGSKKDPLAESLKDEIELIDNIQKRYSEYRKVGVSTQEAIAKSAKEYNATLTRVNATLSKYGIQTKNANELANMDLRGIRDYYKSLLDVAKGAKNTKGIESLEKAIAKINVEITKADYKKITDGLNNELSKLKDEYELSIELDANPELGDMFSNMFGIDASTLPRTFGDAINRAQTLINQKLSELNITSPFDIMETDVERFATAANLDKESAAIKELAKWQNTFRDMFKKNLVESEKLLDDYVKKYGGYSDKLAEIEADRLEKIKKLNDAYYTEEMRHRPEYIAKMNAINQGANREKSNVEFEAFKDSRYYTMMFENLDYVSTKTIRDMRDRLRELMDSMKDLTPEQLKQVMSQYEKLEQKLTKRSPFKTLSKDLKEYFKTSKDRKAANEAFRNAQKEYDAQEKNVAALKEKYEQAKASDDTSQSYLNSLQAEVIAQDEILKRLKEQLDDAQKKADKYNLTKKLALEEAAAVAQVVTANLSSLGELRDQINALFGVDGSKGETLFGFEADAVIDNLTKVGNEISKIISSAQSGNVVGVVGGIVGTVSGIGDAIASVFGDGAARTKRINKEINKSKESVRLLKMAYEDLERAVDKSLGTAETEARRSAIANKEAELAELERQMTLEQSKRSKDRDDDTIKEYQETIHSLRNEIEDLKEEVVNNLLGSDVKSAAEEFVDTWVEAWRAGETTLDAIQEKMDDMILNLVKKAMTSKIVETLLNPIYSELDRMTTDGSEGGVALTTNELRQLATQAGVTAGEINTALGDFYGNLANLGIISPTENERELSALQQGIQGITEDTAGALEAYMNGVSQQVYLHSDLLTQIRDAVVGFDLDVQTATVSQILLQLQSSYQTQQAIQHILEGVLVPSGRAFAVELLS